ncbi:MAG: hypothetical protein II939_10305 [Bacteroidales bacterium]|nr:hypothetical protein [Bacteroidales bacterium]
MKKVLSIIACAMLCAVMFVSCGSSSSFPKEIETIENAFKSKDFTTALSAAKIILNGQDKATADDLLIGAAGGYFAIAGMVQNGQTMNVADALVVTKQIVAGFEQSKAKDLAYYNKCSDEIKPLMNGLSFDDIVSVLKNDWIPQYEAMLAGDAPEDEADYEGDVEEDSDDEEE